MRSRYSLLWQAVLVVAFARGAYRPREALLTRLTVGYAAAIGLGMIFTKIVAKAGLPTSIPQQLAVNLCLLTGFVLSGLLLLTIYGNDAIKLNGLQKVILLLPISNTMRWLVRIVPGLLSLGMMSMLGGIVLGYLATRLQCSQLLIILSWLLGLLSGFGLVLLPRPRRLLLKAVAYAAVVGGSVWLVELSLTSSSVGKGKLISCLASCVLLLPIIGISASRRQTGRLDNLSHGDITVSLIPNIVSARSWLLVKVWRNKRTRNSLCLAFVLDAIVAISIVVKSKTVSDPYGLLMIGAILAASFAGDVRGLFRRHKPPEIVLINGVSGLVWSELRAVVLMSFLIGAPLALCLLVQADNLVAFLFLFASLHVFCGISGLFASTLFVPREGEAGVQFFTGVLASTSLVAIPRIMHFSSLSYGMQTLRWFIAACGGGVVIYVIENVRRKSYGRS